MSAKTNAFSLVEMMMAIMILSIMTLISFFSFNAVVRSWTVGMELADSMAQADYALTQLVSALRSAYYPNTGNQDDAYGFSFVDDGDGQTARDTITWTKLGTAIVGANSPLAQTPHTVSVWVDEEGLMVRAWRGELQPDSFKPEEDVTPFLLVERIQGFNCRMLDKSNPYKDDKPNWQDEWSYSNSIPRAVEMTFYMTPLEEDAEPIELRRVVEIPLWDVSQNPVKKKDSTSRTSTTTRSTSSSSRRNTGTTTTDRRSPTSTPSRP